MARNWSRYHQAPEDAIWGSSLVKWSFVEMEWRLIYDPTFLIAIRTYLSQVMERHNMLFPLQMVQKRISAIELHMNPKRCQRWSFCIKVVGCLNTHRIASCLWSGWDNQSILPLSQRQTHYSDIACLDYGIFLLPWYHSNSTMASNDKVKQRRRDIRFVLAHSGKWNTFYRWGLYRYLLQPAPVNGFP